jgi:16S rRNA (adenine1518-N6/adenine1519-N6)-dimethyltransferase
MLAARLGLRPTKSRGQNFVIDPNTARRVVRAAGLSASDTVLEVGPGLGSLTLALVGDVRHVTAVEIDPVLAGALGETVAEYAPRHLHRLAVVRADALQLADLPGPSPTALVANLPYNVAVPVLLHLLAAVPSIVRVLVMVQLEVADRLAAEPGSRVYGVPSVKAAWFGEVHRAGRVGRNVFWPAPNVDSGLVSLVRRPPPESTVGRERVFEVVEAAFGQRRKMIRSSLAALAGSVAAAESAAVAAGLDPSARAERLSLLDFVKLADHLRPAS